MAYLHRYKVDVTRTVILDAKNEAEARVKTRIYLEEVMETLNYKVEEI